MGFCTFEIDKYTEVSEGTALCSGFYGDFGSFYKIKSRICKKFSTYFGERTNFPSRAQFSNWKSSKLSEQGNGGVKNQNLNYSKSDFS